MKKFLVAVLIVGGIFSGLQIFYNPADAEHITAFDDATVINVSDYVNLREKPSTNSAILARVPRGATVGVSGEVLPQLTNGFYYVVYQGIYGYIYKDYLSTEWGK